MENEKTKNRKTDEPIYKVGTQIKYMVLSNRPIGVIKAITKNANGKNVFIIERENRKGKFDYEVCEKEIVGIYEGKIVKKERILSDAYYEGKHVNVWEATFTQKGKELKSKQGKFIGEFISFGKASEVTGVSRENVRKCCFEEIDWYDKYIFRFVNENEKKSYFAIQKSKKEVVHKYGVDLKYLATFKTHEEAAEAANCSIADLELAIDNKKLLTAGGFIWRTAKGLWARGIRKRQ